MMGRAGAIIMAMSLIGCASATMSEDAGGVDATPDALFDADLPLDAAPVMDVDVFVAPDMALSPVDAHLPVDAAPDVFVPRVGSVAIAGQATFYAHALGEPMVNPPIADATARLDDQIEEVRLVPTGGFDVELTVESGDFIGLAVTATGYADAFARIQVHPESQAFVDLHLAPVDELVCGDHGCSTDDGRLTVDGPGRYGAAFGPGHERFYPGMYRSVDGAVLEVVAFGWLDRSVQWARLAVDGRRWSHLWDARPGTGALEGRAYAYDPDRGWVSFSEGRLVDLAGRPILEAELQRLREGDFAREVFFEIQQAGPGYFALARPRPVTACIRGQFARTGPYQVFAEGAETLAHQGTTYDAFCLEVPRTEPEGVDDDGDGLMGEVRTVSLRLRDGEGFLYPLGEMTAPTAAARCDGGSAGCLDLGDRIPCGDERCDGRDNDCDGVLDEDVMEVGMPCSEGGGIGRCRQVGIYVCDPARGGLVCAGGPEPERCDGLDNDCDERIDELDAPCTVGQGRCARVGRARCIDGDAVCSAVAGSPQMERCDPVDWSCDGQTDDVEGASQACEIDGGCGLLVCAAGQAALRCIPVPPGSLPEACDGDDNDCDGRIDEAVLGAGEPCVTGDGICARPGRFRCAPDEGGLVCDVDAGRPEPERCNGLDDDCNGAVDDVPGAGRRCSDGVGACARSGRVSCDLESGLLGCATPPLGTPSPEECNEIDDDCDGVVDNVVGGCDPPP